MPRRQWWWVDPYACAVVRGQRVVVLGYVQFAVFRALHKLDVKYQAKKMSAAQLYAAVYGGAVDPPQPAALHAICWQMNRKLIRIGLRVHGVNRKHNSFYQLRDLRVGQNG